MVIFIYYLLREVAITPQQYRARSFVCNHFLSRNMLINSDEPIFHALSLEEICVVNFFLFIIEHNFSWYAYRFLDFKTVCFSLKIKSLAVYEIFVLRVEPRTP